MFKFLFEMKKKKNISQRELLLRSGVDWEEYRNRIPEGVSDPVNFFIEHYASYPVVIQGEFDSDFYLENNLDVRATSSNPLEHYLIYGKNEGRLAFPKDNNNGRELVESKNSDLRKALLSFGYDLVGFANEAFEGNVEDSLQWIAEESDKGTLVLPGFFDQKLYEHIYVDLRHPSVNSFRHFVNHGFSEGRNGWINANDYIHKGGQKIDTAKGNIIVAIHETTSTGAPVLALELVNRLNKTYNVFTAALKGGQLRERFIDSSSLFIDVPLKFETAAIKFLLNEVRAKFHISTVLLNSVETLYFLDAAASVGLPTVSLVHEYAEYTRPVGKVGRTLSTADIVIFPADSLLESGVSELKKSTGAKIIPNNMKVKPQGYLGFKNNQKRNNKPLRQLLGIDQDAIVIAGAGHIQARKGVDWFFQTCMYLKQILIRQKDERADKLKFVWLGSGYSKDDISVSVWIETYLQKRGIRSDCFFPGAIDDVQAALAEVDIYLLTSRLDPFPNVCIDALQADTSVGLFEGASGIADFARKHSVRHVSASYGDCYELAQRLAENFDTLLRRDGKNAAICKKNLNFNEYVEFIIEALSNAESRQLEIQKAISQNDQFLQSFDANFYKLSFADSNPAHHFLSLLYRGIVLSKPFIGSDILDSHCAEPYVPQKMPFSDYVTNLMSRFNNQYPVTTISGNHQPRNKFRIAIQFHVFYPSLIDEYCNYFGVLEGMNVDLYVSHVSELAPEQIEVLEKSVSGRMVCEKFRNFGRNVYPFNRQFVNHIVGNYDLVAHVHTKKSTHADSGIGDRWRRYLLSNLFGSKLAANQIISIFDDDKTGMVFAEDAHFTNEGENLPFIKEILTHLDIEAKESYNIFPLGTMFWARVEALKSLQRLPEELFKLAEPVPYDGSTLHAFERVLPQLVEEQGYKAERVYSRGTSW